MGGRLPNRGCRTIECDYSTPLRHRLFASCCGYLERCGYVQRTPHGSARRMPLIELTDAKRKVAMDFRPIVHQHEKVWRGAVTEKEQRQLVDLLHRVQATLTASEEGA